MPMQLKPPERLQEFAAMLQHAELQLAAGGRYTATDRYRDFNAVFGTEHGARVLLQIMHMSKGLPITFAQADQPGYLAHRAGSEEIGHKIMAILHTMPATPKEDEE